MTHRLWLQYMLGGRLARRHEAFVQEHLLTESGLESAHVGCECDLHEQPSSVNSSTSLARALLESPLAPVSSMASHGERVRAGNLWPWDDGARLFLRRIARAKWHIKGVLLWLLQRPYLRFLPLPYPSVSLVTSWTLQAESMVSRGILPRRFFEKCSFTAANLSEATWLWNRLGLQMSFLEDPVLEGMMAAEAPVGRAIKAAMLKDQEREAREMETTMRKEEAVRTFLGPSRSSSGQASEEPGGALPSHVGSAVSAHCGAVSTTRRHGLGACVPQQRGKGEVESEEETLKRMASFRRFRRSGVRQMISQAWEKHRRDEVLLSISANAVHQAMVVEETSDAMRQVFFAEVKLSLGPSFAEVYTDTQPVLRAAQQRGHKLWSP